MTAFYNEIDPFAAAWLRELIKAGHIADGVVDGRNIEDIKPKDLDGFSQCHFFAGIGVWSYALRNAGWPDDRPVWTGSCPCQPFSAAGQGAGFDDERHLWPAFHHLIKECAPATVIGEQVASKGADHWIDLVHTDMEALGYAFGAVPFPSAGVGAPHIRDRLYWVANTNKHGRSAQPVAGLHDAQHHVEPCGGAGGLGHTLMPGRQPISDEPRSDATGVGSPQRESVELSQTSGNAGGLGDTSGEGLQERKRIIGISCGADDGSEREATQRAGVYVGGLADAEGGRDVGQRAGGPFPERVNRGQADGQQPGPTNGLWRDADWLLCRDGKWRPVEPGTFPLAHGSPARVGRLRGFGNAINAVQAQIFIEALMP